MVQVLQNLGLILLSISDCLGLIVTFSLQYSLIWFAKLNLLQKHRLEKWYISVSFCSFGKIFKNTPNCMKTFTKTCTSSQFPHKTRRIFGIWENYDIEDDSDGMYSPYLDRKTNVDYLNYTNVSTKNYFY